jgi:argininosuccinate synthase
MDKVILAYSGGLDTSVGVRWIRERYGLDVVAVMVDIGGVANVDKLQERAIQVGAVKSIVFDAREAFINDYAFPALKAGAIYEGEYPLATAIGRPLIAKLLVQVAREENARAIAHGCTAKGNDQVRLDVSTRALAPDLQIIGFAREWGMNRDQTIDYAKEHNIAVPVTKSSPYSIDENLWGRAVECGVLEDPWAAPPLDAYIWTKEPQDCPDEPRYVEIEFEKGVPVGLDGRRIGGVELVTTLNEMAGGNGVGRVDHIENRLVGIKSREVYECPAALVLLQALRSLEALTTTKDSSRFKSFVTIEYSDLVYNGLWFSPLHRDLSAFVDSYQRNVTGTVRVKLFKGSSTIVGRKSPFSLYEESLATYDKGDTFEHEAAVGFIRLWGLSVETAARIQSAGQAQLDFKVNAPRSVIEA